MELSVTIAVLCAALLHAMWNGLLKSGKDPLLDSMLLALVWLCICVALIPFFPLPALQSVPFIVASIFAHVCYFLLLAKSYEIGDFSAVYPVVRGLPPLIVTIFGFFIIGETVTFYGWIGILTISAGILALEIGKKSPSYRLLGYAVATACMIAIYTLVDGLGARVSGHSFSFLLWFSVFQSIIFVGIVVFRRGRVVCYNHARTYWRRGIIGGVASITAYSIVLWAMTKAPIPYVSALRETSVLFASVIAVVFLSEPLRKSRVLSAILIVCGVVMIRL